MKKVDILFLVAITLAFAGGCTNPQCEAAAYPVFRDYRIGISESPKNSLQYFSDAVLADWLGGIVFSEFPSNLELVHLVRSDVFFGSNVNLVHGFDVKSDGRDSCVLSLHYSKVDRKQLIHLGLTFKFANGRYVIDFFDYDFTDEGPIPDALVDDFSAFQPPENFVNDSVDRD